MSYRDQWALCFTCRANSCMASNFWDMC